MAHSDIINWSKLEGFLVEAAEHYDGSAPTVCDYLNELYIRIGDATRKELPVDLRELIFLEKLVEEGQWLQANQAANAVYKLKHRLGMETTGMIDY